MSRNRPWGDSGHEVCMRVPGAPRSFYRGLHPSLVDPHSSSVACRTSAESSLLSLGCQARTTRGFGDEPCILEKTNLG